MKNYAAVVFVALFSLSIISSYAQEGEKFKALFTYNFTNFIEWPPVSGNFVVKVLGNSPFDVYKTDLEVRSVNGQSISVTRAASLAAIGTCHILYIPPDQTGSIPAAIAALKGKSTLIITDSPSFTTGTCINFVMNGANLGLQVSELSIKGQGLKVNKQLLNMGENMDPKQ